MPVPADPRLLLFTGKGGVGKTTLAAATAARVAKYGKRTLVVSTDPAHSLADAFGVAVGAEPTRVGERLDAVQLDTRALVDTAWEGLREQARSALADVGVDALDAEELTIVPGVDELLALTHVQRLARTGHWHAVVVDCGPTAETLRLLALPEAVAGYLKRISGKRSITPKGRARTATITRLGAHLESLRAMVSDAGSASVRLVLTPERVVVAETRRTLTALALRGIRVDGVVANRVTPGPGIWRGKAAAWLRTRRAQQDAVLEEIRAAGITELSTVEHRAVEPVGLDALEAIADDMYRGFDPLAGSAPDGALMQVDRLDDGYRLRIAMPMTPEADIDLARVDNDLAITVDGYRRLVALPTLLTTFTVTGADCDSGGLVVHLSQDRGLGHR